MKNTLMVLLASLVLAVCLTACGGGVTDGARDALDDAGRSVRNAMDDAGDAMDSVF